MDESEAQNFRMKKNKQQGFVKVQISYKNANNRNVLASKLRTVKTFDGGKMLLYRRWGNSATCDRHGQSYI